MKIRQRAGSVKSLACAKSSAPHKGAASRALRAPIQGGENRTQRSPRDADNL